jgi:acyl carrier protein
MRLLVEHLAESGAKLPDSLRLVMLSGDWIPLSLPDAIRDRGRHAAVVSLGGATEASIWSIFYEVGEVAPQWTSIPYGKPMANQKFHVLDARMEDCPEWVAGDLYIEGDGLAEGYWRDAARTEASFIVDQNGRRLYRTGDLGRYLPDGNIEFLGRADSQVKIQGYRIECGEVAAALEQHPAVQNAVVLAVGDRQTERLLVAFVVAQPAAALDVAELRPFLGERLPHYMVPHRIVALDALPLSQNGKVDRNALARIEFKPAEERQAGAQAETPLQAALCALFCAALGRSALGLEDSFFEAGGTSLQAVRLLSKIESRFGVAIGFARFLENQTVAKTARILAEQGCARADKAMVRLRTGTSRNLFCVHPIGGGVFNFVPLARELGGDLNVFGFQSVGLEGGAKPLETVERMAEHYLKELLDQQPDGPYLYRSNSASAAISWRRSTWKTVNGWPCWPGRCSAPPATTRPGPVPIRPRGPKRSGSPISSAGCGIPACSSRSAAKRCWTI